ncbi:sensor histidine kinase [Actinoplanes sp. L3-i22]|uniref:sensor histidine kinase n=1 Tax=Actinoplanes sp. L3-i22 TaxID=2836373 RepID=UPI001C796BAF|nr:sensor histidine kinase [Actinoplanes sp. L3-i22]BCY13223.1 histidine kinase [Actinoplanes sp. L3-i22]
MNRAWRDLLRAVGAGFAGLAGLPLAFGTVVSLPICPVALAMIRLDRRVADWHRRRASEILGTPVPSPYSGPPRRDEAATWRDLAWLVASFPLGIAGAAIAGGLWIGALECLFAPLIEPFAPPGVFTPLIYEVDSQPVAWLTVLAAPIVGLAAVTVPGLVNRLRARLATALLAPTEAERLRIRVGRLAASREIVVDSSAAELRRIERDLHDGPQVRLVSLAMQLGIAEDLLDDDPALARKMVVDAKGSAGEVLGELRDLVRGIHPPVLADRGLPGAVEALALNSAIPVTLDLNVPGRLSPAIESAGYFVFAEALTNAIKHSGATLVTATITHDGSTLVVSVADNGRGGAEPGAGGGLRGIERRLSAFDGRVTVSSPVGGPTVVHMEVPCVS